MRIVFEQDQLFYYPRGGIAVYLYSLLRQLAASGKDALRLVHASARRRETVQLPGMPEGDIEVKRLLLPGRLTGMLPWPGAVEQVFLRQADLFHAISGVLPPWYRHYHPLVITVHDMVQFRDSGQDQTNMSGARYCTAIRRATELADQIVTVSEFTKRELCDILPVNPEKVTAIPIASQFSPSDFARMQPELPLLKGQRYFLAVSVLSPRKNYQTLLTAWERFAASGPDCRLVVVGRAGWHCDAIVSRLHRAPGVLHLEKVSEAELLALYQHASGYFNVSVYEGFGIPLLEAMSCAVPCCYGTGSAMDEVCADAGIGVAPCDVDAVVDVMRTFYHGGAGVQALRQRAKQRAERFTWENTARKTREVYARLQ